MRDGKKLTHALQYNKANRAGEARRGWGSSGGTSTAKGGVVQEAASELRAERRIEGEPGQREVDRGDSGDKAPGLGNILARGEDESILMLLKWQEMNLGSVVRTKM